MELSVIVVVHNMPREAARTLHSLSAAYQENIDPGAYEVIVVDNGSVPEVAMSALQSLPGQFRLIRIDPAPSSPARALNEGLLAARGAIVGVLIDGARIVTPGLLHFARHGARLYNRAIVATFGWYLGFDYQCYAAQAGYDASQEDALLESIGWPADGYRLFEVGTPDESSLSGWFAADGGSTDAITESNALFMHRESWALLDGFDERFDRPGGGLLNFDLYERALALPDARLVLLLGEGTFHQIHGGIATNAPPSTFRQHMKRWAIQYRSIRRHPFDGPPRPRLPVTYLGTLPPAVLARVVRGTIDPLRRPPAMPFGPSFDLWSWPDGPGPSGDAAVDALAALMAGEFRAGRYAAVVAVARIARSFAPAAREPLRVLSLLAPYLDDRGWNRNATREPLFHVARGKAYVLTGDSARAAEAFRAALEIDAECSPAREELAQFEPPEP